MATLNRHQLRQAAFQALFALSANPDGDVTVTVDQVLAGDPEVAWDGEVPADLIKLINGVRDRESELDLTINEHLQTGWTLDRLNLADLTLMRLALFEVTYAGTDAKIAVNEAIELAKTFTDDNGRRFINGVLNEALTF
jgi:N utilization substance protein B